MTEQDREFMAECIRYIEDAGYRVTRARKPASRQLTGKRLLSEHKQHKATKTPEPAICRLCRFVAAVLAHGQHVTDESPCFLCVDRRTEYLYPSTMRHAPPQEVAEIIHTYHAA